MYGILNDDHVEMLEGRYSRALRDHAKGRGKSGGEKGFGEILKTFETVGAGSMMGFLNAKHAKPGRNAVEVGGVPADLTLGVGLSVFALSNYVGDYSEHVHNLANGLLCAYAVRMGMMWGAESRTKTAMNQRVITASPQQRAQQPQVNLLPQGQQQSFREGFQQPIFDWAPGYTEQRVAA